MTSVSPRGGLLVAKGGTLRWRASGPSVMQGFGTWDQTSRPSGLWRPYGDSSPWNIGAPASPTVDPNSAAMIADILGAGNAQPDDLQSAGSGNNTDPNVTTSVAGSTHPIYYSHPTDSLYTIEILDVGSSTPGSGTPSINVVSGVTQVRMPDQARPAGEFPWASSNPYFDLHMSIIDWDNNREWVFFRCWAIDTTNKIIKAKSADWISLTGDGLGPNVNAGQSGLAGGTIRAEELLAGRINHALYLVVPRVASGYKYPAHGGGTTTGATANTPKTGQMVWWDQDWATIQASGLSPWKQIILRALNEYGGFIMDTGSNAFTPMHEGPESYTAFGLPDAWQAYCASHLGADVWAGGTTSALQWNTDIDWASHLHCIDYPGTVGWAAA